MIIDLSLSIISWGVVSNEDKKTIALDFIAWLQQQNLNPSYYGGTLAKPEDIVNHSWDKDLSDYGQEHYVNFDIKPRWEKLEDIGIYGHISFYPNSNQYIVRVNVFPDRYVKNRSDHDDLAERITSFAKDIHKKINAEITVLDRNTTTLGMKSPYNLKTLPLWIGWFSLYGEKIGSKYHLNSNTSITDLKIEKDNNLYILKSTKRWSEYKRYGWSEEVKTYLKSIGGKLLFNK